MKMGATLLALCCLAVVSEARPQAPAAPQVLDIAAAYEQYHQLWLAEAQRNSIAPVSLHAPAPSKAAPAPQPAAVPEPIAEVPPAPEPAAEEPLVKAAEPVADTLTVADVAVDPVPAAAAEAAAVVPDMNTAYAEFHRLWLAEAERNAIAPTLNLARPIATQQEPQQAAAAPVEEVVLVEEPAAVAVEEPVMVAIEDPAPALVAVEEPAVIAVEESAPVNHEAEFARFHEIWQQEAARNAIPPQVGVQSAPLQVEVSAPQVAAAPQPTKVEAPTPVSPEVNLVSPVSAPANPWAGNFPIVVFLQPTV